MKKILSFIYPYRNAVFIACFFMIIDVIAEILQPVLMANIVGKGLRNGDMNYILMTGGLMILMALLSIASGIGNARFSARAGVGFAAQLRQGLFSKVQMFSFKNIDAFSTASLATRLTNDVTQMQNTAIMGMRLLIRAPLMLIFSLFMAIRLSLSLSAVLAFITPVLLILLAIIVSRAMPMFQVMQASIDQVNRDVQENVTNVRVVKSFVREDFEKDKFKGSNDNLMNASLKAMNLVIINMPLMMLIMNVSILSILWIGGNQVIDGDLDVATMSAFINYIMMILMSLMMISMVFILLTRASASYKRIKEVLEAEIDLTDSAADPNTVLLAGGAAQTAEDSASSTSDGRQVHPESGPRHRIKGEVAFRNVSFKYDESAEGEDILTDINFTAHAGEVTAIIGGTGAGKSSLVQLIPRLYDVTEGEILIDGRNVKEFGIEELRSQIGMVLQKNTLFSGTIRDNLKWGNPDATEEEVMAAAKNAQAHDFISSFPDGYDTWIEQGGVNVSGGQKQRLCIARAMLKKPPILILDDSTSAVDTATESRIRAAFDAELKDTATFIIAQRISSVQDADKIIVMDDGRIVAVGTHDQLLLSSEEYREIYESQMGKEVSA